MKLGEEAVVQWLTELAVRVWETDVVPKDWLKQLIVSLYEKGAFDQCDNFQGIAFLS